MLLNASSKILEYSKNYQSFLVSTNRMEEIYSIQEDFNGKNKIDKIDNISCKNINFSFGNNELFRDFNVFFNKGELTVLCGKNGTGKSTLLYLLLGIYYPNNGEISFNDINLKNIDLINTRLFNIGITEQQPYLIEGTIWDNLTYGIEKVDNEMKKFIENNNMLRFVEELSDGMLTKINSKSSNLSGGQKQRIAICRTILKNPDVYIFDEPTSALDSEGKRIFIEILNTLKKIKLLLLSHMMIV